MPAALTIPTLRKDADSRAKHARGCKKPLDACPLCTQTIGWFRSLPPETLAYVLADYGKPVRG